VLKDLLLPAVSALAAALLALAVNEWARSRHLKEETRRNYLTSQIREFYGPLYSMLKARNAIFQNWNKEGAPLQLLNEEVKALFMKQNLEIERLVLEKGHLIEAEGGKMPDIIAHVGAHTFIWNACIQRFGEVPKAIKPIPEATWPVEFQSHIEETLVALKAELDQRTGSSLARDRRGIGDSRAAASISPP
jgi:hypothetical protein